ncbi:MAG: hypothetical protein IPJ88_06250 [Myxococcales bacterium]|nr:MAG: hypothetical protein IPJ88_06250 [Myxococcales bacterium]
MSRSKRKILGTGLAFWYLQTVPGATGHSGECGFDLTSYVGSPPNFPCSVELRRRAWQASYMASKFFLVLFVCGSVLFCASQCFALRTVGEVYSDCKGLDKIKTVVKNSGIGDLKITFCLGYVRGAFEMLATLNYAHELRSLCVPPKADVSTGKIVRLWQKWVEQHPKSMRKQPFSVSFIRAMEDAFPCEKQ